MTVGTKFTEKQETAIEACGQFIIVSAAAGSGKTTVLIEKLIRLLSDEKNGIRADQLIIVTFTNDAAAQIIRKLGKALDKAISDCGTAPENADKKRWLMKQQSFLGAAKISTISSFCFNLIRSRAEELGISPDFRIIDENENSLMLFDAVEETADSLFESGDEEKTAMIEEIYSYFGYYTNSNPDKMKRNAEILSFRRFLLSIPYYEERFIKKYSDEYSKGFSDDFDPFDTLYGGYYSERVLAVLNDESSRENYKTVLSIMSGMMNDPDFPPADMKVTALKYYNSTSSGVRVLEEYFRSPADKSIGGAAEWDKLFRLMSGFSGDFFRSDLKLSSKTSAAKNMFPEGTSPEDIRRFLEAAEQLGRCFERFSSLSPCTAEELKNDYRSHYRRLNITADFIKAVNTRCSEMKQEKNVLSFEDGEQLALRLLGRTDENGNIVKTPAAQALSEEYKFIMIDEFQDSNDLQDIIFRLLSPCGTSTDVGRNMFVVGDIKQSIYNFRLANPMLFRNYLVGSEEYTSSEKDSSKPANVLLNMNFRSSRKVIDFVNLIFGRLMTDGCGGIDYDDSQKLIYSGDVWESLNSEKAAEIGSLDTEILLIDKRNTPFTQIPPVEAPKKRGSKSADLPPSQSGDASADSSDTDDSITEKAAEARVVALKIRRLLDEHPKLHCRDICILCPAANQDAPFFEAELNRLGIRAAAEKHTSYLESREISTALNLLRMTDDPHGNIAAAGCLMSPVFGFTAEDMAVLTILRKTDSIYDMLLHLEEADSDSIAAYAADSGCTVEEIAALAEKSKHFLSAYRDMRECAAAMSIEDTIRMIYDRTGLVYMMSLYPDGDERRANLNLLPGYARAYEQGVTCGTGGIYGFIRYIDKMLPGGSTDFRAGSVVSESDDAVAIKTIHKSKGLEYPIVFLCRAHTHMQSDKGKLFYTLYDGAAFTEQDSESLTSYRSLPADIIRQSKAAELSSERLRLMYVALTRAKHKLFISGMLNLSEKNAKDIYRDTDKAVYAGGKYSAFECDVTNCPPDAGLVKELFENKSFSDMFTGDTPSADSLIKANGRMLHWIIAALYAEKSVPYFSADGTAASDMPSLKIYAERTPTDSELEALISDEECAYNNEETAEAAEHDEGASDFEAQLKKYHGYETDEMFRNDILKQDIPAKLTVTEITKRAYESSLDTEELSEPTAPEAEKITHSRYDDIPVLKIADDESTEKLTAAEKGTAVHAFMQYADFHAVEESILSGAGDPIGDEAARLELEDLLDKRTADFIIHSTKLKKRIASFVDSELWQNVMKNAEKENILREQPFMAKISDIFDKNVTETLDEKLRTYYNDNYNDTFVQGIADCIVKTKDGFVLIDYKTNEGKTAEELRDMYCVQLLLYTRVFELIFGLPIGSGRAYIYSLGVDGGCTVGINNT